MSAKRASWDRYVCGVVTAIRDDLGPTYWVVIKNDDGEEESVHAENICTPEDVRVEDLVGKRIRVQIKLLLEILD